MIYKSEQLAKINSTRFKDRLLKTVPNLTAVTHGRDVLLTFSDNLGIDVNEAFLFFLFSSFVVMTTFLLT